MNLRQRIEPIRSAKLMAGAKGQPCDLNFAGVCSYDPDKTVAAHIHDETFGAGRKADDTSTIHACSECHMWLDHGWVGKMEWSVVQFHIIRGLQRTLRNRIDRGLIYVPVTVSQPAKPKARKPPSERAPLRSNSSWPAKGTQKIPSRAKLAKENS